MLYGYRSCPDTAFRGSMVLSQAAEISADIAYAIAGSVSGDRDLAHYLIPVDLAWERGQSMGSSMGKL